jgi:hypothetical protein
MTNTIPAEIRATTKQYFGLAGKFSYMICEANDIPKTKFNIVRKRCAGVLHSQFPGQTLTRGQVQEFFDSTKIPAFLTKLVKLSDLTEAAPVKVKAVKRVSKTKTVKKTPVKAAAKTSVNTDFDKRLAFLEGEVSTMSDDIQTIKSGLDSILEAIKS